MIVNEIFHGVQCDRCGEMHDGGDYSFYSDEQSALDSAIDDEWIEEKGRHYCAECYEVDEETGKLIIYPPYPDEVKKVSDFILNIIKAAPDVKERIDHFFISFNEYHLAESRAKTRFDDAAKNWIKAIATDVTIEHEVVSDRQTKHFLTIKKQ